MRRMRRVVWTLHDLNRFASNINDCTRAINGGLNGLPDRMRRLNRASAAALPAVGDEALELWGGTMSKDSKPSGTNPMRMPIQQRDRRTGCVVRGSMNCAEEPPPNQIACSEMLDREGLERRRGRCVMKIVAGLIGGACDVADGWRGAIFIAAGQSGYRTGDFQTDQARTRLRT